MRDPFKDPKPGDVFEYTGLWGTLSRWVIELRSGTNVVLSFPDSDQPTELCRLCWNGWELDTRNRNHLRFLYNTREQEMELKCQLF